MNGIEKITARITATAQAEVDAITAETESRCQSMMAAYELQAQDAYRDRIRKGVQENERRVDRLRKSNTMDSKKHMLSCKQELISQAFSRAMELFESMEEAEYIAFLAHLASNASETGDETVLFNEKDRVAIGSRVVEAANRIRKESSERGALVLGEESRAIRGGLVLKNGPIETNCSLEKMMELRRSELAAPVAAILFN